MNGNELKPVISRHHIRRNDGSEKRAGIYGRISIG
jgi:hypothetical protein